MLLDRPSWEAGLAFQHASPLTPCFRVVHCLQVLPLLHLQAGMGREGKPSKEQESRGTTLLPARDKEPAAPTDAQE